MTDLAMAKTKQISREKLKEILVGKTINDVQCDCGNVIGIELSDGTEVMLEVEAICPSIGFYGFSSSVVT